MKYFSSFLVEKSDEQRKTEKKTSRKILFWKFSNNKNMQTIKTMINMICFHKFFSFS